MIAAEVDYIGAFCFSRADQVDSAHRIRGENASNRCAGKVVTRKTEQRNKSAAK